MAHMQTTQIESAPPRPPVEVSSEPIAEISATLLRAQTFLSGSGISLMVREGSWLVCRASNGAAAPEIGARIAVENTFLGLCVTLKKPQSCEDADSDLRVENLAYSRLRPKSIMAVPVRSGQDVIAVLASFSSAPNAFSNTQVAILRTVADSLSRPVQQLPLSPPVSEPMNPVPWPGTAPSSPEPVRQSAPKPEPPSIAAPAPAAPPAALVQTHNEVLTLADDVAPRPILREPRPSPPTVRVVTYSLPSFELTRTVPRRRWRPAALRIAAITAACLVCAFASAGWYSTRLPAAPPRIHALPAAPAIVKASVTSAAAPATVAPAPAVASAPAVVESKQASPAATVAAAAEPELPVTESPSPEPVAPKLPERAPVSEAPTLAFAAPSGLPVLAAPHAAAPKMHHSEVVPARLETGAAPQYPPAARGRRIAGQVVLSVVVRKDGSVGEVKLLSGNPIFLASATDALKRWHYAPATLDGEPVEATAQVTLKFDPRR